MEHFEVKCSSFYEGHIVKDESIRQLLVPCCMKHFEVRGLTLLKSPIVKDESSRTEQGH